MKEFKKLQKENEKIRKKIYTLLKTYMMSEEVINAQILINQLVENELQQEEMCGK